MMTLYLNLIKPEFGRCGIPIYSKSGFEADDAIGTIADQSKMDEVVIITGQGHSSAC